MNRVLKIGIGALAGLTMQGVVGMSASAAYLGYDNGDPGGWDYNTEQAGGPCNLPGAHAIDPATGQAKCCAQYNPSSACPLARLEPLAHTPLHYYRHARRQHDTQS